MKNKIVYLISSALIIAIVFPAVGLSIQTVETNTSISPQPSYHQPPPPGSATFPPSYAITDKSVSHSHPKKAEVTMDDIVISMIEQVDENIYLSYLENITNFGPRVTGTSTCEAAAEYIYSQFESMGLDVRYHHWNNGGYSSDNVEATINGTDESSDEIYVVCGHYDTVPPSPGADDDGSGTVAVLLSAYIMSQYQFNHTIKFVAFSGEEEGLLGSEVYANEAANQGWNIIGVLNCDMISYAVTTNDGNNLIVFENTASEWLWTYTSNINTEYSDYVHLTLHHGGSTWGSDHNSFWDAGYDALFYFEYEETPYYHTSQDTIEHINATYAAKNIRLILATLAELSEAGFLSNPPAKPELTGPTMGVLNQSYTYTVLTTEPDDEDVYYYFEWGDGTNSGWIGPFTSGTPATAQKSWSTEAVYLVKAKAKDINQVSSEWSDALSVSIINDNPPNTPTIDGPARGKVGTTYTYTVSTVDINGDQVYYKIDWGDGQIDEWVGPYNSGTEAEFTHVWNEKGTYTVMVKAKDIYDIESSWGAMSIVMPTEYILSINEFLQHLFDRFPRLFPILQYIIGY